jgi:hypothetical protein
MNIRSELRTNVIILGSLALTTFPATVQADNAWGNYHWERSSNPFSLKLGENVSSAWASGSYLGVANTDWNASSVLDNAVVAGSTSPKRCRPKDGRVEVCSASYGNTGWLGLAQIWVSGGHITKGAVKVNDTYFDWDYYNTSEWRQYVMCQEVGHIFGLAHQDEDFYNTNTGSCMDYTNSPESNVQPNGHDYAQLADIYSVLDDPDDGGGGGGKGPPAGKGKPNVPNMPPAMTILDLDGPGQWGELISGSRDRGASTYMLDFGGGFAVITFVTWISE